MDGVRGKPLAIQPGMEPDGYPDWLFRMETEEAARKAARETGSLVPPPHILNAPTKLMREMGRGAGYEYDHDAPDGFSGADYWPEGMGARRLYEPSPRGLEARLGERMAEWARRRAEKKAR